MVSQNEPQALQTRLPELPGYLSRSLEDDPYRSFIVARAAEIALENGHDEIEDDDLEAARWEFRDTHKGKKSWAGFYYASGGAILSVGLGALVTGYYFMIPPFSLIQLLPFFFLTFVGLLLIFAGRLED